MTSWHMELLFIKKFSEFPHYKIVLKLINLFFGDFSSCLVKVIYYDSFTIGQKFWRTIYQLLRHSVPCMYYKLSVINNVQNH